VEPDGKALAVGKDRVEFLEASGSPQVCRPGEPLQIKGVIGQSIGGGESFDLKEWNGPEKRFSVQVIMQAGKPIIAMTW
jgi:hypothetical protein